MANAILTRDEFLRRADQILDDVLAEKGVEKQPFLDALNEAIDAYYSEKNA